MFYVYETRQGVLPDEDLVAMIAILAGNIWVILRIFATVRRCKACIVALSSNFCDAARTSCVHHFLRVNLHSYCTLRAYVKLLIFILSGDIARVCYE